VANAQLTVVGAAVVVLAFVVIYARAIESSARAWVAVVLAFPVLGLVALPRDLIASPWTSFLILFAAAALLLALASKVSAFAYAAWPIVVAAGLMFIWLLYDVVFILVAVGGLMMATAARLRIRRLRLAESMVPGGVQRKVAIGGTVRGRTVEPPPGVKVDDNAAWWVTSIGDDLFVSGDLILEAEEGPVLVEGSELTYDFKASRQVWAQHADERALRVEFGMTEEEAQRRVSWAQTASEDPNTEVSYSTHWLAKGEAVHVVGVPDWDRGPAELGGYRDAPTIPVFRNVSSRPHLVDRPIRQARNEARFDAVAWTVFAVATALAIVYLEFL